MNAVFLVVSTLVVLGGTAVVGYAQYLEAPNYQQPNSGIHHNSELHIRAFAVSSGKTPELIRSSNDV